MCLYTWRGQLFAEVFIFVSNIHIHAASFGAETCSMTSNRNTQHGVNAASASDCYDWPRHCSHMISLWEFNSNFPVKSLSMKRLCICIHI